MTAPATTDLVTLLRRARVLLLDFDGPICAIFAGHPAPQVARELLEALRDDGDQVPDDLDTFTDPFDVLRFAATRSPEAAKRTDARLRAAELAAVPTARPTPHADSLIRAWRQSRRRAAVVSNNAQEAVTAYLDARGLELDAIVGRTSTDPALLKPNPHIVACAIGSLDATADESVLIGDSPSDIAAARCVGIDAIGFANKPRKLAALATAGADVVVETLDPLHRAVSATSGR